MVNIFEEAEIDCQEDVSVKEQYVILQPGELAFDFLIS